jgi:hypothetical protein
MNLKKIAENHVAGMLKPALRVKIKEEANRDL